MENSNFEQEEAIREVGRGYDIIKQLRALLQLKSRKGEDEIHMHELAGEALQTLNQALCIMRSGGGKAKVESGLPVQSRNGSVDSCKSSGRIEAQSGKRRLGKFSWIDESTRMPYDDGYQWRKYGNKQINGSDFSRSYYRCTYQNQGCQAKKIVQQTNSGDPPLFQVKYTDIHTCNYRKRKSPLSPLQPNKLCSIEQNMGINRMLHVQECIPTSPKLLNQGSCSGDQENLRETNASLMDLSICDWEMIESWFRD